MSLIHKRTLGPAQGGGTMVADEPAREADRDRREGRQPWPLCHAEVAASRQMFAEILSLNALLRVPWHRHDGASRLEGRESRWMRL